MVVYYRRQLTIVILPENAWQGGTFRRKDLKRISPSSHEIHLEFTIIMSQNAPFPPHRHRPSKSGAGDGDPNISTATEERVSAMSESAREEIVVSFSKYAEPRKAESEAEVEVEESVREEIVVSFSKYPGVGKSVSDEEEGAQPTTRGEREAELMDVKSMDQNESKAIR